MKNFENTSPDCSSCTGGLSVIFIQFRLLGINKFFFQIFQVGTIFRNLDREILAELVTEGSMLIAARVNQIKTNFSKLVFVLVLKQIFEMKFWRAIQMTKIQGLPFRKYKNIGRSYLKFCYLKHVWIHISFNKFLTLSNIFINKPMDASVLPLFSLFQFSSFTVFLFTFFLPQLFAFESIILNFV